jgi:hypothetical protein
MLELSEGTSEKFCQHFFHIGRKLLKFHARLLLMGKKFRQEYRRENRNFFKIKFYKLLFRIFLHIYFRLKMQLNI